MSKSRLKRVNGLRFAFAALVGAAFLATSVPANAQEQEEEDNGYDIQIIRRVLSAVGLRDDKPPIDYRERSPLVVPPTTSLPAPMSGNVTAANWPVDPEIKEQRMRNAAPKAPGATGDPVVDDGKPLQPSEMAKGRAKRGVAPGPIAEFPTVSQKELGSPNVFSFFSKAFSSTEKEESKTFTQEAPRASLLEPPPGYQTPASTYAYGVGKKDERPTAKNYSLTHGEYDR
jgi:hypothetical protein